jgi:hypothetical protein
MRCRFSAFRKTFAPTRSSSVADVITGVRCATPFRRAAAARTSSNDAANGVVRIEQDLLVHASVVERHVELVHAGAVAGRRVLVDLLDLPERGQLVGGVAQPSAAHRGGRLRVLQLRHRGEVVVLHRLRELVRRFEELAELKAVGLSDEDAWDIASVAAFFGFSNRMAGFMDMRPNPQFHEMGRPGQTR